MNFLVSGILRTSILHSRRNVQIDVPICAKVKSYSQQYCGKRIKFDTKRPYFSLLGNQNRLSNHSIFTEEFNFERPS